MNQPPVIISLSLKETRELRLAKESLENPGFTARLANLIGSPIEKGFQLLPNGWSEQVGKATRIALMKALHMALGTLGKSKKSGGSSEFLHKILAGASGGIGGAFGLAALPLELPISTTVILRSIADIARDEGHDLSLMETRLECLEVFAFGAPLKHGDTSESVYWGTRMALSKSISDAVSHLAQRGANDTAAPVLIKLVNVIASRFGIIVSEEIAAKAVPVIGAFSGSVTNVLFMAHFQEMARAHFTVKRLEKKYGTDFVRKAYGDLPITDKVESQ
jgi:hypothetical protein